MKDERIDKVIGGVLGRAESLPENGCPDEGVFAAYLDSKLEPNDHTTFESHCASCSPCRELLALSLTLESPPTMQHADAPRVEKARFLSLALPVSAFALIVIGVLAGFFYVRLDRFDSNKGQIQEVAEVRTQTGTAPPLQELTSPAKPLRSDPFTAGPLAPGTIRRQKTAEKIEPKAPAPQDALLRSSDKKEMAAADQAILPEREPAEVTVAPIAVQAPAAPVAQAPEEKLAFNAAASGRAVGGIMSQGTGLAGQSKMKGTPAKDTNREKEASGNIASAESQVKKIGEKTFAWKENVWIDEQCSALPEATTEELSPESPEMAEVLKAYPDLKSLHPVVICWKSHRYSIR